MAMSEGGVGDDYGWRELAMMGRRCDAINKCRGEEGIWLKDAVVWVDEYIAERKSSHVA